MSEELHRGSCFCGSVEIQVAGQPEAMGYCHCQSCRHWSASPVNAFTLWKPSSVEVIKGADRIGVFNKTERSARQYCKSCGGHLLTDHPLWGLIDVYAAILPTFAFRPQLHVNYQESVLRMRDDLPKMKDLPAEMGGSGERLPE